MTAETRKLAVIRGAFRLHMAMTAISRVPIRVLMPRVQQVVFRWVTDIDRQRNAIQARRHALIQRAAFISRECEQLGSLSGERKKQLVADNVALAKEVEAWQASPPAVKIPWAVNIVRPMLEWTSGICLRRKRKLESFAELLERVEGDTFYFDLFLWFVLPVSFSDSALGDLNEEFLLKMEALGEKRARAWYRKQVIATVRACVWAKIDRVATVATLIDFVNRLRRK